jgi:hypothetical protein
LLENACVIRLEVPAKLPPRVRSWFACAEADLAAVRSHAQAQIASSDNGWKPLLKLCGDVVRAGAREGKTSRTQVIARTYLMGPAAHHAHLPLRSLTEAVAHGLVSSFFDPEEKRRLPAAAVEQLITDEAAREAVAGFNVIKPRDLAVACGVHRTTIRRRLLKIGQSTTQPTWGAVRGQWELPATYAAFKQILDEKWRVILAANQAARQAQVRIVEEQRARERAAQEALRQQLIAAFPDWRHEGRAQQQVTLSIGPANSGKTHAAIERLIAAGSGWYLAPLRLLAYEISDRLNRRGIPCNLLTGEESLPVSGACITAATIEMFNPMAEGGCVVIDEAQMLADPDRGWAWTRALMEARAREIHVLGSANAQDIVERLLRAVDQPFTSHARERLAPLTVAADPWKFKELPARTILVAFSRARVLELKTALENMERRVSIVYGALPPEVRRRQADRFAAGETEICVATDAVGMGLNLPADHVCFAETSKYDGRQVRPLTSAEIHQIGGRAGRYGFASAGIIGALGAWELDFLRRGFERDPEPIKRACVAPSVADLALIPGRLAARLRQWRELASIPPTMQSTITTADLTDRIDLALMLRPDEEERLGLAAAVKLTNAPTRRDSRTYWRACAMAVLADESFPLPPPPPNTLAHSLDLDHAEMVIACADLYLWLARTPEFMRHGPAYDDVRSARYALAELIDAALIARLDTRKRCPSCGRILSERHRFRLCDDCYYEQRYQREAYFYGYDEDDDDEP